MGLSCNYYTEIICVNAYLLLSMVVTFRCFVTNLG
jgi:hypothetical protein